VIKNYEERDKPTVAIGKRQEGPFCRLPVTPKGSNSALQDIPLDERGSQKFLVDGRSIK
jgi:hypothetical protein